MSNFEISADYGVGALEIDNCPEDPMALLRDWTNLAKAQNLKDFNAMVLSTSIDGRPNSRVVFYKSIETDGLVFFTNCESQKGRELASNPEVHLLFFWPTLEKQIRLRGMCSRVEDSLSDTYFEQRDRKSQIASLVSKQSSKLPSRKRLEQLVAEKTQKIGNTTIKRPKHWGGYRVVLREFEFWQGRPNRLNDRIKYQKNGDKWQKYLLFP